MIKHTGIVRHVDELGRIVLPRETREELGIEILSGLEVLVDTQKRQIILQPENCESSANDRQ